MSSENSPIPPGLNALRACKLCKLIKSYDQFLHNGCENCEDILHMAGDDEKVREMTSPYFDGMVSIMDREHSWVASWLQKKGLIPAIYAINVTGRLPDYVREDLQQRGMYIPENFEN
ncbi:transcription elongation factor SPT4 [Blastocystis sp. ATCC 50177/Nand II]|uniref:Transcription elongation factor SPT4 n=1 Tax=Blastocystis sp. subtype 1 (strain ATCC 50177 / NandII) TaxID=478820 RepID=A0A196SIF8_BLAHN|nr:transcription elongation factor SPT4 [Blastocystis sp. ATCC 50177/Nand II]